MIRPALFSLVLCGALAASAQVEVFDPTRDAQKDIAEAVNVAATSGRHVLLDVGGNWCIWCKRLDRLFEEKKELREFRDAHYVTVKVNYSKEQKNTEVLSKYPPISGYPHLFVLNGKGELIRSQETGVLEEGKGHSPEKIMAFLRSWAPGGDGITGTTTEKK